MTNNSEMWVLEWSQRANVFHIQPMERTLSFNRRLYADDKKTVNDYRILFVGTHDDCDKAAEASRSTISEREKKRIEQQ